MQNADNTGKRMKNADALQRKRPFVMSLTKVCEDFDQGRELIWATPGERKKGIMYRLRSIDLKK